MIAVVVVDSGSVVVAGTFGANSGFGTDLAVARYGFDGERAFLITWRSPESAGDLANAFTVAPDGNLYFAGASEGGAGNYAALVAAFDGAGQPLWHERFDGPGASYSHFESVRADGASRACVAGRDPGAVELVLGATLPRLDEARLDRALALGATRMVLSASPKAGTLDRVVDEMAACAERLGRV